MTTIRRHHASPMEALVSIIAALSAFAAAVGSPAAYIWHVDHVSFEAAFTVNLIAYASLAYAVYEVSNALSGVTPQRSYGLNVLDTLFSTFAFLSLTVTLGVIVIQYVLGGGSAANIVYIFGGVEPLIGATVFSWIDIGYIQRRKWQLYRAQLNGSADADSAVGPISWAEYQHLLRHLTIASLPAVTDAGIDALISGFAARGVSLIQINIPPRD